MFYSPFSDIADANILPFNAKRYSTAIEKFVSEKEELFGQSWKLNNVNMSKLFIYILQLE